MAKDYRPRSAFTRWLDSRLPLPRLVHDQFVVYPTPRNLNIWYAFGAILAFFLAIQLITGVVLAMHYVADASLAFDSVQAIMREVRFGWLFRNLHAVGASLFFFAIYVHLLRGLYYGSYKAPREIVWIIGILIYLAMVAAAFLGYVLPWGQMSYWAATVITSLFGAVPLIGEGLTHWLWGDYAVGAATLNRFYALHYLMGFVIVGLVALHIWALHVVGNGNPSGIDVESEQDTLPFHPYFTVKDAFVLSLFLLPFAWLVFFAPDAFSSPDNSIPADPMVTPSEIRPEWYFLPFYAMLRAVPFKLLGAAVMMAAFFSPLLAPWLDRSSVRSCRYRPLMRWFFWGFVGACVLLGYIGGRPADAELSFGVFQIPLVWLGRLATLYYLGYFWVVMPVLSRVEMPLPVPKTIADPVLDNEAGA